MQNASPTRPARLAMATLPGLDHFVPDIARDLPQAGVREIRVFPVRAAADMSAILAWTDRPGDAVWLEFCWPPFPGLISSTDFGHRRVLVRVHRIEAYEADHVARTDWSRVHDLVVVSTDMARVVREVQPGIDRTTRLHVVHNGVDAACAVPRLDFDKYRIGWCGAFIARKNPALALQVLHALHRDDPRYVLHVAAQSSDRLTTESFLFQAESLGLTEAVRFDGRLAADDMPAWHARNGVLLSTSLHESFGCAIAEAAAAGCDIAVLDHPGAAEFWPAERRFTAVDAAAALIRGAAPNMWCGLIAERFSLNRQVAALRALLDAPGAAPGAALAAAPGAPMAEKPWSTAYWEQRYRLGGDSGAGSSGRLARFKAETINRFVAEHGISSVTEFGCGDGRQLALANYPAYVGLDVSTDALRLCAARFADDAGKTFLAADDDPGEADLVLSLDVVFHLIEDDVFHSYMARLFAHARRFVAIYASDRDAETADAHVRHRNVTGWVSRHAPQWQRVRHVPNPYPFDAQARDETSFADFHIFARRAAEAAPDGWPVRRGNASFTLAPHGSSDDAIAGFTGAGEAATLAFFDAVLPRCRRMIDIGAYVGAMSLYAATMVPEVHAIEASPTHQALLRQNLACNPGLAQRITLHTTALGAHDGTAALFRKAHADSGSSLFEWVERTGIVRGEREADVAVRNARTMLEEIGVDSATLIKIDVEGAEYDIVPALAPLLAARRPFLQLSFHPFNIVGADAYRTALARIAAFAKSADALADFSYIYLPHPSGSGFRRIDAAGRLNHLAEYLMAPKPAARIQTLQYGYVDAVGFSWDRLPALDGSSG